MLLEDAFIWLGETPPGVFLAESTPAFAVVQSIHILAFGLLGGAILALDLAALRVVFRNASLAQTGKLLLPVFVMSLAVAAISGLLLVAAGPLKYYTNPLFAWKLVALAGALAVHLALYPILTAKAEARSRAVAASLGLASLVLWFGVATLGRWIGLI
ncbi:MAG: hypothetical protein EON93_06225 [Burkholderiales bacterium]|nr:MAG: hypothetical protein EON93_06225 [Burkholderiales bacterium]